MRIKELEKNETNSSVDKKLRRQFLCCPICPPNRGENRCGRTPKPDKYKNKRYK